MSDEGQPRGESAGGGQSHSRRRQVLALLGAGIAGGVVGSGLNELLEDDDGLDGTVDVHAPNDSREYDVVLSETDDGYSAVDPEGGTINSGADGWRVLENSIDAAPDSGSILVSGEYAGRSAIDVNKSLRIHGKNAVVDHRGDGEFAFRFQGTERFQTSLAAAVDAGTNSIELDRASGVERGDMVLLEDADGAGVLGRGKPPGEPHSVLSRDGRTLQLEDSVVWQEGYDAGTRVYVLDPISVQMSGFRLQSQNGSGDYFGVLAQACRDSRFENLWLDRFGNRGILLEACANSRVHNCTVLRSADIQNGNGYGIQVWAGCHDILVSGCTAKECRHPLSVTAGGPREVASRSLTFRDCFVTADGSAALNCHGGSAHDVRFEGCKVHTRGDPGVRTGARKTNVAGCEFRMDGHNAIDTRDDGQAMQLTVTDTDVFGAGTAVHLDGEAEFEFAPSWKLVQLDGVRANGCSRFFNLDTENIDRVRELVVSGCYWDEVDGEGFRISNRIDGGIIEGNDFGGALSESHVHARDTPNTDVNNLQIVDNRFRQPTGGTTFVRLAHSQQCEVSDNTFEADADVGIYVDGPGSTGNIVSGNTYYAPSPASDPADVHSGSVARNNAVYDTDSGRWR
ncbi:right-handed parallel beta-helix repeat-containing protein [Haloarcula laminariae]|uniref:right-handed parallel beta-helix repeat-containing protein n=1 Tax=Haloarcula laminariae TaxID=2961577 RepID=UPI0021C9D892|nr:right-handed parallel beta-helix repeat-containing protein [Halomicroarcula laminariae]